MEKILNKKRKFEKPQLEVIEFSADDIIVTSSGDFGETTPNPGSGDVFNGWW